MKDYHHIHLSADFLHDCKVWLRFLATDNEKLCRPFVDFSDESTYRDLLFTSDASLNPKLGMGAVYKNDWMVLKWEDDFIRRHSPSIEMLELYALTCTIVTWGETRNSEMPEQPYIVIMRP